MTFITVVRNNTFPAGSVEVELTGLFTGNLTGNVLNATVVQSAAGQFDLVTAKTLNGAILFSDDVCIDAANVLQVDTINDKSGSGVTIEGTTILNGVFTSNICIDSSKYLQTDHIEAKTTLITVHDPIVIAATGDQIRFTNGIEIGDSSTSTANNDSIAIGKQASANTFATAIGSLATASLGYSIAVGNRAQSSNVYSIAIGSGYSNSFSPRSLAYASVAIGTRSYTNPGGFGSVALGFRARCLAGYSGLALGYRSQSQDIYGVAVGAKSEALAKGSVAIGAQSDAGALYGVSVGYSTNNSGIHSISIGSLNNTNSLSPNSVSIGYKIVSYGTRSILIGNATSSTMSATDAIAIGTGASVTQQDQIRFGNPSPTSATATATAWGQTFQDRAWADTLVGFAKIDGLGNLYKDTGALAINGNLDMFCYNISNVNALEVNTLTPKTAGDINVAANLVIDASYTLAVDTVKETTLNAGVTVDGVLLKDNMVTADAVKTDALDAKTTNGPINVGDNLIMNAANVFKSDTIASTSGGDITFNNSLCVSSGNSVKTNTIYEKTLNAGVTVDGVLLKDNDVEADEVRTDTLSVKAGTQITVTEDLVPSVTASWDLGKPSFKWNNIYGTNLNIMNDATILGNLTVAGTTTTINTENVLISDNKVLLNNGETGAGVTMGAAGWVVDRGTLPYYNVCFDELRDCLAIGIGNVVANLRCVATRVDTVDANGIAYFNTDGILDTTAGFTFDAANNQLVVANVCATDTVFTDILDDKTAGFITVNAPFLMSATGDQIRFTNGIEIGDSTITTTNASDIAIGKLTDANGGNSVALGQGAQALGASAVAIGYTASVSAVADSIAIGHNVSVQSYRSVAIGKNVKTSSGNGKAVSIGYNISNSITGGGFGTVCIGSEVMKNTTVAPNMSVAIGYKAGQQKTTWNSSDNYLVVIGYAMSKVHSTNRVGREHVAVGRYAMKYQGTGNAPLSRACVAIGLSALERGTTGQYDVAIGGFAGSSNSGAGFLTASHRVCIGTSAGYCIDSASLVSIGRDCMGTAGPSRSTKVTGANLIAIGRNAMNNVANPANNNIAIGYKSLGGTLDYTTNKMTGYNNIALGHSALSGVIAQHDVTGIGKSVVASGNCATVVGASASGTTHTAVLGYQANAGRQGSIAVGQWARTFSSGTYSIAIGGGSVSSYGANANGNDAIAIGRITRAYAANTIAMSPNARAEASAAIAMGFTSYAKSVGSISIGRYAKNDTTHAYAIAIGCGTSGGNGPHAYGTDAIAIGRTATSAFSAAIAIGRNATASAANCVQLGQATNSTTNATLKFRSQIIGNEAWISGGLTPAAIDNNGNIVRANASVSVISNLICALVAVQTPLLEGKNNMQILVGDNLVMDAANVFKSDTIASTSGGDILFNDSLCVSAGNSVKTDTIYEKTTNAGVTVDGVLLKDSNVTAITVNANTVNTLDLNTDTVNPKTGTNVTFTGTTNTFNATTNAFNGTTSTFAGNVIVNGYLSACTIKYCYSEISSSTHTIVESDDILGGNTLANAIVFTLPLISTISGGGFKSFTIVDIGGNASGNNITIMTSGGDTLFGGTSMVLSGDYNSYHVYSDGTSKWFFA